MRGRRIHLAVLCLACLLSPQTVLADTAPRLLALSPHLAELACAAGACEQLVARVEYTDYPPSLRELPTIGNAFALSPEAVAAASPDRVLAWQGGTPIDVVERLRAIGLTVDWIEIRGLDGIADAIERIGELAGTPGPATAAASAFRSELARLRETHADRAPVRVLYQIELQPMYTVSRRSPIHDAIEACGGINVFAELPAVAASVSGEAAVAAMPEVIVHAEQDDGERIRQWWARFQSVPAVAGGHIFAVDADRLSRATPRMLGGTRELCERMERVRRGTASPR